MTIDTNILAYKKSGIADVKTILDLMNTKTDWTPTVAVDAGSLSSASLSHAYYRYVAKNFVHISLRYSATYSATWTSTTFTTPFTIANDGAALACTVVRVNSYYGASAEVRTSDNKIVVRCASLSLTAAAYGIRVNGIIQIS